jgi:hypothetical protein
MLKRVIRVGIRRSIDWLHDDDAPDPRGLSNWGYGRLNTMMDRIQATSHGVRPHFVWGLLHAANLAKSLSIDRISAIEFGVAGGNGLLSLEETAGAVGKMIDIEIDVYGFDTGMGLPKPNDYRDLPNLYRESAFKMDEKKLRGRLKKAQLLLGPVESTVGPFAATVPAPVGFVSFDLDYYTSTMHAFKLFDASASRLLPRVHCYFDDILGFTFSEFTGERLAITEFNAAHMMRKISPIFGLRHFVPSSEVEAIWVQQMFMAHIFDHELYGHPDGLDTGISLALQE